MCRRVFERDHVRILQHARAHGELAAYQRLHSAVSTNKGVSFGLVPLVGLGAYAHIFKTKPTDLTKHKQAICATIGLAILTNVWAAYSSAQIPAMRETLTDKYVWTLPDQTLEKYAQGNHMFPNAK